LDEIRKIGFPVQGHNSRECFCVAREMRKIQTVGHCFLVDKVDSASAFLTKTQKRSGLSLEVYSCGQDSHL